MAQTDIRIPSKQAGVQVVQVDFTVSAGVDPTAAVVFSPAFAAAPRVIGVVRVDANAAENLAPSINSLSATGFTLRLKGTSAVVHTYQVTLVGDLNNPTAY